MNIQCLTHVPFEDAANIAGWANARGHRLNYTRLYLNEPLPALDAVDLLAVMGGPMNVDELDAYPWLAAEKQFIRQAVDAGRKIIGVCLGAQLIVSALGAPVTPNPHKEIGWHPVTLTEDGTNVPLLSDLPRNLNVFHWHGDTFALPPGAVHLAASDACAHQAFLYGTHVLALQFHLEYTPESIEKMLTHCARDIVEAPFIQTPAAIRAGCVNISQAARWLYTLLDRLTAV